MAFNANTYRLNQYRKAAWLNLAQARDIKARVAAGTAYDWEERRIAHYVFLARNSMSMFRSQRAICRLNNFIRSSK